MNIVLSLLPSVGLVATVALIVLLVRHFLRRAERRLS
jgi:hypothetical protein